VQYLRIILIIAFAGGGGCGSASGSPSQAGCIPGQKGINMPLPYLNQAVF
jgi:hypothetical protein